MTAVRLCSCIVVAVLVIDLHRRPISCQGEANRESKRNLQEILEKRASEWTVRSAGGSGGESGSIDGEMPQRFSLDGSDRLTVIGKLKTPMEDYNGMPSPPENVRFPGGYEDKMVRARQVDPLHSCIEAKCSGYHVSGYIDCVYQHCIVSLQLGDMVYERKRLSTAPSSAASDVAQRQANDLKYALKQARIGDVRAPGTAEQLMEAWSADQRTMKGKQTNDRANVFPTGGLLYRALAPDNENVSGGGDERGGVAVKGSASGQQVQWRGGNALSSEKLKRGGIIDPTGACESIHCSHLPIGEYAYNICVRTNCGTRTDGGDTLSA